MRTNIEIEDKLISSAKKLSKAKTKKEVVNLALEVLIKVLKRRRLLDLYGKVKWQGNLNEMRS
jgi:Arc/MetJ family transcription regulator